MMRYVIDTTTRKNLNMESKPIFSLLFKKPSPTMPGISSQHVRDRRFRLLYPLSSRSQPSKQLEARREVVKYGKDEKRKKRKYVWEARNRRRLIRGQNTCILPKKRKLLRGCTCSRRVPPEGYQACAVYRH